ncbi:unnamed protein product [Cyclocybe aegerita]|uniref:Uncharacterized protein n=1 Tax=Cyclocybe aegerita TaxID=1973307 RepID=A0A8S0XP49_CYCAE|nr:unnamed protein product [Cyclocybe aegerita]
MEQARTMYRPPPLPHPITLLDNYELAELVKGISSPRASETAMYIILKGISGRTFLDFQGQDLQILSQGDQGVREALTRLQEAPPEFLISLHSRSPRSLAAQFDSLRDDIHPQQNRRDATQIGSSRQNATQDNDSFPANGELEEDVVFDLEPDHEEEGHHFDADSEDSEQDSSYQSARLSVEDVATNLEASEIFLVHPPSSRHSEDAPWRPLYPIVTPPQQQRSEMDIFTALRSEAPVALSSGPSVVSPPPSIISDQQEMNLQPQTITSSDLSLNTTSASPAGDSQDGHNDAEASSSDDEISYCSSSEIEFPLFPGAFRLYPTFQGSYDAAHGPSNRSPIQSASQSQADVENVPSRDLPFSIDGQPSLSSDPPVSSPSPSTSISPITHHIPGTTSEMNVPFDHDHDARSDTLHNGLQGQGEPRNLNAGCPDRTSWSESTSSSPSSSIEREELEGSGLICHRDVSEIDFAKSPILSSTVHDDGSGYGSESHLGAQAQAPDSTTTLPLPSSVLSSPHTPTHGLQPASIDDIQSTAVVTSGHESGATSNSSPECTRRPRADVIQAAFSALETPSIADDTPINDAGCPSSLLFVPPWSEGRDGYLRAGVTSTPLAVCLGLGRPERPEMSTLDLTPPTMLPDDHPDIQWTSIPCQEHPRLSPIPETPLLEVTIDQTPFRHHFILPSTDDGVDRPLEHEESLLLTALWTSGALDRLTIAPDGGCLPRDTMLSGSFSGLIGSQVGPGAAAISIADDEPQSACRNDGDSHLLGVDTKMNERDLLQVDTPNTSGNPPTIVPPSPSSLSGSALGTSRAQLTVDLVASAATSDNPEAQTNINYEDINAQPNHPTLLVLPAKDSSSLFSSLSDGSTIVSSPRTKLLCLVADVQASSLLDATPDNGSQSLLAFVENANYTFFDLHGASTSMRTDATNDGCICHDDFLTSLSPPKFSTSNAEPGPKSQFFSTSGTSATGAEVTNVMSTCASIHALETSLLMTDQPPNLPRSSQYGSGLDPTPLLDILSQDVLVITLLESQPVDLEPENNAEGHPDICRTQGERTGDGNVSSYETTLPLIPLSPSGSFFEEFPPSLCDLDYFRDDTLDASLITPSTANSISASRISQDIPRPSMPPVAESYFEDSIQGRISSWPNFEASKTRSTMHGVRKTRPLTAFRASTSEQDLPVSYHDASVQTDVHHHQNESLVLSQEFESNMSTDSSSSLSVRLRENGLLREIIGRVPSLFRGKGVVI